MSVTTVTDGESPQISQFTKVHTFGKCTLVGVTFSKCIRSIMTYTELKMVRPICSRFVGGCP